MKPSIKRCFQIVSNINNLPQVDFSQGVKHPSNDQKKWAAPELNFRCCCKGSDYLCQCDILVFYISKNKILLCHQLFLYKDGFLCLVLGKGEAAFHPTVG